MSLTIALPKGRMSEESLQYLYDKKVTELKSFGNSRKLIFKDEKNDIEYLLIRSKDVGTYVEHGAADLGVIGYDSLIENDFSVYIALDLPFGECRLSVAYPEFSKNWQSKRNLTVATKYPKTSSKYFFNRGQNIKIIKLYGSIEIAPLTGIADLIVDLVSTGQTLKANNLTEGPQILQSSARLIANPGKYHYYRKQMNDLFQKLRN